MLLKNVEKNAQIKISKDAIQENKSLGKKNSWNGRTVTLIIGECFLITGLCSAILGGAVLFGGATIITVGSAKVLFLCGLFATGGGFFTIVMTSFYKPTKVEKSKEIKKDVRLNLGQKNTNNKNLKNLDLDKAILTLNAKELNQLIKEGKLKVEAISKRGISYIRLAILERIKEKDVIVALAATTTDSLKYEDIHKDLQTQCEEMEQLFQRIKNRHEAINSHKSDSETSGSESDSNSDDDVLDSKKSVDPKFDLLQHIQSQCPISSLGDLFPKEKREVEKMLKLPLDMEKNNYWHQLANPTTTPGEQDFLRFWFSLEFKENLNTKLFEKNSNQLTPIEIACQKLNWGFILAITEISCQSILDWKKFYSEKFLEKIIIEKLNWINNDWFAENEEDLFIDILREVIKCSPTSLSIDRDRIENEIYKIKSREPRVEELWKRIKLEFSPVNIEQLMWEREVEKKLMPLQIKCFQDNKAELQRIITDLT